MMDLKIYSSRIIKRCQETLPVGVTYDKLIAELTLEDYLMWFGETVSWYVGIYGIEFIKAAYKNGELNTQSILYASTGNKIIDGTTIEI